ncbi:hypothetical protein KJ980_01565, partial [Patescibacteria group bacterium]|nr:hypothetical protein [Patescibacteria group bacterium]
MAEQGSEITKNTTTHEQKPITAKPIEPLKPEQIEKLSDQKTTQALADETKGQQVLKKIED